MSNYCSTYKQSLARNSNHISVISALEKYYNAALNIGYMRNLSKNIILILVSECKFVLNTVFYLTPYHKRLAKPIKLVDIIAGKRLNIESLVALSRFLLMDDYNILSEQL